MPQHAPGRSHRKGLTIRQLFAMFPDDDTAERWFERQRWPEGPVCPNCGGMRATRTTHPTMSLRCKDCRKFFSVRKGTVMEATKLGYQTWAIIVYMATTSLKGVSSMKIHRELGVTQKTAWFLISRIREAYAENDPILSGEVEVDETYVGGKEKNKAKRIYDNLYGAGVAVDVVVVTPGDIARYRDSHALVIKPALNEGRVVYGRQGFSFEKAGGLTLLFRVRTMDCHKRFSVNIPFSTDTCQPPPPTTGLSCRRCLGVPVIRWGATE